MSRQRIQIARSISQPRPGFLFRARKISAHEVEPCEVAASSLWIGPLCTLVGDAGVFQPSDMLTNRRHPVMSALEVRSGDQHLFQRRDGLRMLKVFRWAPQDPGARQLSLGQLPVERQGPAAVILGFLKPLVLRVKLKADVHRDEGQRGVCQREVWVSLDRSGQMIRRAPETVLSIGGALAKARHELAVRLWIAAVSIARLPHTGGKPAFQRFENPAADFVLDVEYARQAEVVLLGERNFLGGGIEQLHRHTPVGSKSLNRSLQAVSDAEITAGARRVDARWVVQNRGRWCDNHILQVGENRDECIRKT